MNGKTKAKAGAPRRRGRPGPATTTDVRETILATAERMFANGGFAATTVRQIADAVTVNPAMVHYYFGSKQSLLEAVMERVLEPLADAVSQLRTSGKASVNDLARLMLSTMAEHPGLPQLIAREVFLPGGQLQEDFIANFAPRLGGRMPEILRHEQETGKVDPSLDAHITTLLILALCFFPFIARPAAEQALNIRYDDPGLARLAEHVTLILDKALKP